jgi:hypothetical protein
MERTPTPITTEQALETVERVDGERMVAGVPIPPFVIGDEDTARWANAQRAACELLKMPPASAPVWQTTRLLYEDRTTYPD